MDTIENQDVVKDIPNLSEVLGFMPSKMEFSPTDLFDLFEIPDEYRYTFTLKPLSDSDKYKIEAMLSSISLRGLAWAKGENIDVSRFNMPIKDMDEETASKQQIDNMLFIKHLSSLDDKEAKFGITQQYVVGLKDYKDRNGKSIAFKKENGKTYLSNMIWSSLPDKIKEAVYSELLTISNLSSWEIRNL